MTIRTQMIEAVSYSRSLLNDSTELVVDFITSNRCLDGGFKGRDGKSDLYYTMFAIETLMALRERFSVNLTLEFLRKFKKHQPVDLIHLAALIRCYTDLEDDHIDNKRRKKFLQSLAGFRSADGGFANEINSDHGSAYSCFCAIGAYQDLGEDMPDGDLMQRCIGSLITPQGGYVNNPKAEIPSTNATAAAMMVLHYLSEPIDKKTSDWLLRQCHLLGGFGAIPKIPLPDLLSTATSLHALVACGVDIDGIRERCIDFVDSLWSGQGGFYSSIAEAVLDCEYTYYGLLALGNLAE